MYIPFRVFRLCTCFLHFSSSFLFDVVVGAAVASFLFFFVYDFYQSDAVNGSFAAIHRALGNYS